MEDNVESPTIRPQRFCETEDGGIVVTKSIPVENIAITQVQESLQTPHAADMIDGWENYP